ncbi:endonuclease/exonuclease/phosphatase family protein [candidate division CSSED10-310 bacterium]|uniref:Endonuclease/exonuclease/phosphatase family protein n=1 Tax=candidate division CSSED10-310 bacterium TaxID=2855610 RepID=A0ABV6YRN1_UNCC1
MKIFFLILGSFSVLLFLITLVIWLTTYHPSPISVARIACTQTAPLLTPGQKIKLLSWNVQYMAGKNYVFFYDLLDNSGPDDKPLPDDISRTLEEVSRVIRDVDPDIILLQEVDDHARRTGYQDQGQQLLSLLHPEYSCFVSAYYWKALFVPHPRIMGQVGMKLMILSKYSMSTSFRHQLAYRPSNFISRQLGIKRAALETRFPVKDAPDLVIFNTHLEAFTRETDIMNQQVSQVDTLMSERIKQGHPCIIGGDFNLLPPGQAYFSLPLEQRAYFREKTEIAPLFEKYQAIPSLVEINGPQSSKWFTHFPNDPAVDKPDRTIDYIFMSHNITLGEHSIRQHDTLKISDHLPLIVEFELP